MQKKQDMSAFSMDDDEDDDLLLASCSMDIQQSSDTSKRKTSTTVSSSAKKQTTWISSSFDGFKDFETPKLSKSISKDTTQVAYSREKGIAKVFKEPTSTAPRRVKKRINKDDLWADRYKPHTQDELAVHKKKIGELQDFLENSLNGKHRKAPILLLTGPSGVGKTATVRVLADQMSIEIQEWINPTTESYDNSNWQAADYSRVSGPSYQSQTTLFQDFLLRADRYPSLQIFNQHQLHKKLILVEDFPNTFFRNTGQFHDILRNYHKKGQCPLVFIVSDSAGGDSNERLLFPKDVQAELCVSNISFNPVAPTSLTKVLTRIAATEANQSGSVMKVPSKSTIEGLAAACSGDIRGAINALQFACLKDTHDLDKLLSTKSQVTSSKSSSRSSKSSSRTTSRTKKSTSKKQTADEDHDLAAIGGRDTSLFLFRALGKILYCKRGDPASCDMPRLPDHLSHCYRDPLTIHPEDVIEKSQLSGEFFSSFLHQNYTDFYSQLTDVVQASEYLSDADYLTTEWASRSVLCEYAASIAARALMFCNSDRATSSGGPKSGLGWKPLHKPHIFEVNRKVRSNKETARCLFRGLCSAPEEIHMNIVPYMGLIRVPLRGVGQASYVQELCKFDGKNVKRWNADRLDERDIGVVDVDDDVQNTTSSHTLTDDQDDVINLPDDQVEIEEFDY